MTKTKPIKLDKLVLIEWVDAHGGTREGWRTLSDAAQRSLSVCKSVGWIIRADRKEVVIIPHTQDEELGDGELVLPRKWIKRIAPLVEASAASAPSVPATGN